MKKIVCIILCLATLLSLAACGGEKSKDTNAPVQSNDGAYEPGDEQTGESSSIGEDTSSEYTLSEYLATGETIWFCLRGGSGKDANIEQVYVLEPDGTMYFGHCEGCETLGDYEKMEDADIVAGVKEYWANEPFRMLFEDYEEGTTLETIVKDQILGEIKSIIEPTYADMVAKPEEITAKSADEIRTELQGKYVAETWLGHMSEALLPHCDTLAQMSEALAALSEAMLQHSEFLYDAPYEAHDNCLEYSYCNSVLEYYVCGRQYQYETVQYIASVGLETEVKALETAATNFSTMVEEVCNAVMEAKGQLAPDQYRLCIESDSTGNNTKSMKLYYTDVKMGTQTYIYSLKLNLGNSPLLNMQVYDSFYADYSANDDMFRFVTRVPEGTKLFLDKIGECDLPVDVEDYESLFN